MQVEDQWKNNSRDSAQHETMSAWSENVVDTLKDKYKALGKELSGTEQLLCQDKGCAIGVHEGWAKDVTNKEQPHCEEKSCMIGLHIGCGGEKMIKRQVE